MLTVFKNYIKQEDGATAIEYGMIAGLLSLIILAALLFAGPELQGVFDNIGAGLEAANTASSGS